MVPCLKYSCGRDMSALHTASTPPTTQFATVTYSITKLSSATNSACTSPGEKASPFGGEWIIGQT